MRTSQYTPVFPDTIVIEEFINRKIGRRPVKSHIQPKGFDLADAILINQDDAPAEEKNLLTGQYIISGQPLMGGMFE